MGPMFQSGTTCYFPKHSLRLVKVVEDREYDGLFALYERTKKHLLAGERIGSSTIHIFWRQQLGPDTIERRAYEGYKFIAGEDIPFDEFCKWIEEKTKKMKHELIMGIQYPDGPHGPK